MQRTRCDTLKSSIHKDSIHPLDSIEIQQQLMLNIKFFIVILQQLAHSLKSPSIPQRFCDKVSLQQQQSTVKSINTHSHYLHEISIKCLIYNCLINDYLIKDCNIRKIPYIEFELPLSFGMRCFEGYTFSNSIR